MTHPSYAENIRTGNTANGAAFRTNLAKGVTGTLEKGFAMVDFYNIGMSQNGGPLEIPLIGAATQGFINVSPSPTPYCNLKTPASSLPLWKMKR